MALIAMEVVTNIAGFLMSIAISMVVSLIVVQVFGAVINSGAVPDSIRNLMTSGTLTADGTRAAFNVTGNTNVNGNGTQESETKWDVVWGLFGVIATEFSIKLGYAAWHDGGKSVIGWWSLVWGAISLSFAYESLTYSDPCAAAVLALISLMFGGAGLGLSIAELANSDMSGSSVLSAYINIIISGIALFVSGIGTGLAFAKITNMRF